jgi:Cu2+-exporting ATPase
MVGVGKGAEHNILIKDAESLELAHKVNAVIVDKTGTITEGKPAVTDTLWTDDRKPLDIQALLLAVEVQSEHPLAEAVVEHLKQQSVQAAKVSGFESITGKGVKAQDEAGNVILVGNLRLMKEEGVAIEQQTTFFTKANQWHEAAKTVVYMAINGSLAGVLAIADQIKASSAQAIQRLQENKIEVFMLTGDNEQTAAAVARQVNIKHYQAEVMPSDKAEKVKALQAEGKVVAMVGDGINDSHALAQADVSIAMGAGSDIAMDVAKITLITSDLNAIPKALKPSKKTVAGVRQNLFWAFIYNALGIPIAAGVLYPINGFLLDPMIAGAAMALSSVSVVLNSLRLKTIKL